MSKRQCFPCTACCEGWLTSTKIEMSPGSPCQHCTSQGCAIYESRPKEPCQTFKCAWLRVDSELPDELRPDLCGAIVVLDQEWRGWKVMRVSPTGEVIPESTLDWIKDFAVRKSIPLMFESHELEDGKFGKTKILGYGPPEFVHAVQNAITSSDVFKM